jgi:hypothetical protein
MANANITAAVHPFVEWKIAVSERDAYEVKVQSTRISQPSRKYPMPDATRLSNVLRRCHSLAEECRITTLSFLIAYPNNSFAHADICKNILAFLRVDMPDFQ